MGHLDLYLSSADMMTRNMVKRVEILFPVLSPSIKMRIMEILDLQLKDTAKGRIQDATWKLLLQRNGRRPYQ